MLNNLKATPYFKRQGVTLPFSLDSWFRPTAAFSSNFVFLMFLLNWTKKLKRQTDIKRLKTNSRGPDKRDNYAVHSEKVKVADLGNLGRFKRSKTTRPRGSASSCFCIPSNPNSKPGGRTGWRNSWQISEEMSAL